MHCLRVEVTVVGPTGHPAPLMQHPVGVSGVVLLFLAQGSLGFASPAECLLSEINEQLRLARQGTAERARLAAVLEEPEEGELIPGHGVLKSREGGEVVEEHAELVVRGG